MLQTRKAVPGKLFSTLLKLQLKSDLFASNAKYKSSVLLRYFALTKFGIFGRNPQNPQNHKRLMLEILGGDSIYAEKTKLFGIKLVNNTFLLI